MIKIAGEWIVVEPMAAFLYTDGRHEQTVQVQIELRAVEGVLQERITVETQFNVLGKKQVGARVHTLFPVVSGDRIGRRDGGEYELRPSGQQCIAVVA